MRQGRLPLGESPDAFDPELVQQVVRRVGRLFGPRAYFGLSIHGLEALPPPPAMLVSNHSGGTLIPDVWGLGVAWYRHFGKARPLYVLGHELIFSTERTGRFFERCGVLRASNATARRVLAAGRDLLALPGGDVDTWRPYKDRYKVCFAGRKGYARLAIEAGVPLVPVAHAGAHETLRVLTSGRRLAKWLGLQRVFRAQVFPVHLSLPWGLAVGPLPHLPWPARFRYLVGDAIEPGEGAASPELVDALDARVRAAVQAQLDLLARG